MVKKQNKKSNKIKTILLAILLMFSCFFSCFNFSTTTYAATSPTAPGVIPDYSLFFKDLKEENGAVYVYVNQYEYSDIIYASSINVSTDLENLKIKNYKLEFVEKTLYSSATNEYYLGTYTYKYLIKDLPVYESSKRVYEITSIYRPYSHIADGVFEEGTNIPTEIAFAVEKCFTYLTNEDGTTSVSVLEIETVYITDKFVGFVRYNGGYGVNSDVDCDSHFVAFSTDKDIDRLIEADVYYTTQSYKGDSFNPYGSKVDCYASLKASKKITYKGENFFANKYEWNEIQSIDEFFESVEINNTYSISSFDSNKENKINAETRAKLENKQWVLRFSTTEYMTILVPDMGTFYRRTIVGDVSILRLKFETGGTTFEYGVIDDKTTGSKDPIIFVGGGSFSGFIGSVIDGVSDWFSNLFSGAKRIIIIIILVILFFIALPWILPCVPAILKFFLDIIKAIINFLIWLIKLPIKIFKRD